MSERTRWGHWAPLTGVLAAVLWVLAFVTMGEGPADDAGPAQIAAYFEDEATAILVGGTLFGFGCLAFVLFLGVLRSRMTEADRGDSGRSTFVFGAGLLLTAMLLGALAPQISAGIQAEDGVLLPGTADALWIVGDGLFVVGGLVGGLFLISAAVVALRSHVFASWLAWFGAAVGVVMLVPPIGWAGLIFAFPVWLVAAGVVLTLQHVTVPTVGSTAQPAH